MNKQNKLYIFGHKKPDTDSVTSAIALAYLKNKQVAVVRVEDEAKYKSLDDMKEATICVEAGSAGQLCVVKED